MANKQTLCKLIEKNLHTKETEAYFSLVRDFRFCCKYCGRVAVKKKYLCKPVKV